MWYFVTFHHLCVYFYKLLFNHAAAAATAAATILRPFVRDYPGELVPEGTFTHAHLSWLSIFDGFLHLLWSIASSLFNLPVQFMCLTVFLHNLSPSLLWCTSCSGTLYFILHTFLADRTIGRAYGTVCRLSLSVVCRRLWRFVLWQNGAS